MKTGAGLLFITQDEKQVLFLKRGPGGDFPGAWCFPGGHQEAGETAEQCAVREAEEELGGPLKNLTPRFWTRTLTCGPAPLGASVAPPVPEPLVDFTTFLQRVPVTFEPRLNDEHVGYAWAPPTEPPGPLHPGCQVALDRLTMDELGVARAMADGRLSSPQLYENVTLFAIRITGTGAAYRSAHQEYVWRDPSIYLNDEFLQRCNGLAVIFEHPKGAMLNSKEFNDRIVGTILLPFLKGDEVWGIAKVYDAAAVKIMTERQLSTSPAVTWRDLSVNVVVKQEDGSTLLIEGKPSLLDHIAICDRGVWDKDGKATGVQNDNLTVERTDTNMIEDEKAASAEKARKDAEALRMRADAEAGEKIDVLLSHMDSFGKRFDALEKRMDSAEEREDKARKDAAGRCDARADAFGKRKDGESDDDYKARHDAEEETEAERLKKEGVDEKGAKDKAKKARHDAEEEETAEAMAADKKRKDADAEKEEKERADAARADASVLEIRGEVDKIRRALPKQLSDADFAELSGAQARADSVLQMFGRHASRPMQAETLQEYRLRICNDLKEHSPAWKNVNLGVVAVDDAAFEVAEKQIFADARRAAMSPTDLKEGELRAITRTDSQTHRTVTEFFGNRSFVRDFTQPAQYVTKINTGRREAA